MNAKHILAISGSPRPNGFTAAMLDHAVSTAEKRGYRVTKLNLYQMNLAYCTGCRACLATGICVQKDDIRSVAALIKDCHMVILAAPVYWANVPAAVKNLFDRLLGTAMEETATFPKPRLSGRKYMLLTACNTPAPFSRIFGQSSGAIRCMEEFFRTAGMKSAGKIVCTNTSKRKALPESVRRKIEKHIP